MGRHHPPTTKAQVTRAQPQEEDSGQEQLQGELWDICLVTVETMDITVQGHTTLLMGVLDGSVVTVVMEIPMVGLGDVTHLQDGAGDQVLHLARALHSVVPVHAVQGLELCQDLGEPKGDDLYI